MKPAPAFLLFQFLLIFLLPFALRGQAINTFNFNIKNGLPSNHIYYVTRDTHGYLWIATNKGVVRYNGYEFKLFDLSDGLPNADVWQLYEDKRGRMWVVSISDNIGYIHNNKYYKANLKNPASSIYPGNIRENKSGIFFLNSNMGKIGVCAEHQDTIDYYPISESQYPNGNANHYLYPIQWFSSVSDYSLLICDSAIYKVSVDHDMARLTPLANGSAVDLSHIFKNLNFVVGNNFLSCPPDMSGFTALDLHSGKQNSFEIRKYCQDAHIDYTYPDVTDSSMYAITDNNIVQFDYKNGLTFDRVLPISTLITDTTVVGNKIRPVHNDSFWGLCIGTTSDGLWTKYDIANSFTPVKNISLDNYNYLGSIDDSLFFWWNSTKSTLAWLGKANNITYRLCGFHTVLKGITRFRNDTLLLFGTHNYFFDLKKKKITELMLRNASAIVPVDEGNIIAATSIGL